MSRPLIMIFGGQSSRDEQMFARLRAASSEHADLAEARLARCSAAGTCSVESSHAIQTSVFAVTSAWLAFVLDRGSRASASAGLSLGEYSHLVEIAALEADEAMALVHERGRLYDTAPEGCMAAIAPVSLPELADLIEQVRTELPGMELAPAVYSAPRQIVVGGSRAAVHRLIELAESTVYASAQIIESHIAMHCPRFQGLVPQMAQILAASNMKRGRGQYWSNVTGTASDPEPERMRAHLTRHLHEPVLWRQTMDALAVAYPDAVFLEVGPRRILHDLARRRWLARSRVFAIDSVDGPSPAEVLEAVDHALG